MPPFRFYLITDRLNSRTDPLELLPGLAEAGLRALQVREKDLSPEALLDYCRKVDAALADGPPGDGSFKLYLNDRADFARQLGWAGAHLRENSLPLAQQPEPLRQALSFGVSTHSLEGVLAAGQAGADFVTFGPVFDTPSKRGMGAPVGLTALEQAAGAGGPPLFALGGITPARCADCLAAGAHGVAAISALWNADKPLRALAEFQEALGGL